MGRYNVRIACCFRHPPFPFRFLIMRVLVTGATGLLGNNLTRALLAQGHQVVAAIRSSSNRDTLAGLNLDLVTVDFGNVSDLSLAMEDVDVVVHAAALIQIGWTKLEASREANVGTTVRLAQAARRRGIRMIYVSSVDALGVLGQDRIADETVLDPPSQPVVTWSANANPKLRFCWKSPTAWTESSSIPDS